MGHNVIKHDLPSVCCIHKAPCTGQRKNVSPNYGLNLTTHTANIMWLLLQVSQLYMVE